MAGKRRRATATAEKSFYEETYGNESSDEVDTNSGIVKLVVNQDLIPEEQWNTIVETKLGEKSNWRLTVVRNSEDGAKFFHIRKYVKDRPTKIGVMLKYNLLDTLKEAISITKDAIDSN